MAATPTRSMDAAMGSTPDAMTGLAMSEPTAWLSAARRPKSTPSQRGPFTLSHSCSCALRLPKRMASRTPERGEANAGRRRCGGKLLAEDSPAKHGGDRGIQRKQDSRTARPQPVEAGEEKRVANKNADEAGQQQRPQRIRLQIPPGSRCKDVKTQHRGDEKLPCPVKGERAKMSRGRAEISPVIAQHVAAPTAASS
ncbi:hypothetical protein Ddc_21771 [Ditylenchus destructor]|nr:hypothetical protein Ddc_21771 [Ditylenchus destructor]